MERDAVISHGASSFLRERLMLASDKYQAVFCATCSTFAVNDPDTDGYKRCILCKSDNNFGKCTIPYAYKQLTHLLAPLGINLRPKFLTNDEYANRILHPRGIIIDDDETRIATEIAEEEALLADQQEDEANVHEFDDADEY